MEDIAVPTLEIGLAGRAKELCLVADTFEIEDEKTMGEAADLTRQIKTAWGQIEEERDTYVRPLFTAEREYNDQFKVVQVPLKAAEEKLRLLMKAYSTKQAQLQREEVAKQKKEQLEAEAAAAEKNEPPPPPPPPPPKQGPVVGAYGTKATLKEKWVHELEDKTMVPLKFLMVDDKAVKAAIAEGVREIRGIRIYDEGQVAIS